jgi:hypothetical protein
MWTSAQFKYLLSECKCWFRAYHMWVLTESFDSKLGDAGNPLVRQLGRHLCVPGADWSHPRLTEADWLSAGQSRLPLPRRPSRRIESFLTTRLQWLTFSVLFLSCRAKDKVYLKRGTSRQLPDIRPTKFLFAEDKLPYGIILPPVAIAPTLNMSKPSAKTAIPLA